MWPVSKERKIIIFAHPRSGSSTLRTALNVHPFISLMLEPFHHDRRAWNEHYINYKEKIHSTADLDAALQNIYKLNNGFKTLRQQLPRELNQHMFETLDPSDKIILIHRENVLQTAVSIFISLQIDMWIGAKRMQRVIADNGLEPISIDGLKNTMESQKEIRTHYKEFLTKIGRSFYEVTYEELYSPEPSVRRAKILDIFNYLELFEPNKFSMRHIERLLSPAQKVNSIRTYRRIPNIDEINATLGSKEDGYLF